MKTKQKNKNLKKGFTLIELLIVIAIIGILTAVLLVSMSRGGVNNTLRAAGRQLAAALRETQNYALTGKQKEADVYPCAFKFSVIGNEYQIQYTSRSINEQCNVDGYDFEDFIEPVKFVGVESVEGNDIIFTVPHANYTPVGGDVDTETEFTLKKKGKEYKIRIYPSGRIEEVDLLDAE